MANTSETNVDVVPVDDEVSGGRCACSRSCMSMRGNCHRRMNDVKEFALELKQLCRQINVKERARKLFTVEHLKTRLPIVKWLPKYRYGSCRLLHFITSAERTCVEISHRVELQ